MGKKCDDGQVGIGVIVLGVSPTDGLMAVSVVSVNVTITVTITDDATYEYHIWLSDSVTDPEMTILSPSPDGIREFKGFTNSSGSATITFRHTGAQQTWYAWGTFKLANVSGAITVG